MRFIYMILFFVVVGALGKNLIYGLKNLNLN